MELAPMTERYRQVRVTRHSCESRNPGSGRKNFGDREICPGMRILRFPHDFEALVEHVIIIEWKSHFSRIDFAAWELE